MKNTRNFLSFVALMKDVQIAKKLFLTITMLLCVVWFATGCSEMEQPSQSSKKTGEKLQEGEIDFLQKDYLDTIFSEKNQLIPALYNVDKNIYIINSAKELDTINFAGFPVDIDFSKYTLIGGRITATSMLPSISVPVSLTERNDDYLLSITVDYSKGGYTVMGNLYFWRLYPKLKYSQKNVTIEIKEIHIGE